MVVDLATLSWSITGPAGKSAGQGLDTLAEALFGVSAPRAAHVIGEVFEAPRWPHGRPVASPGT